MSTATATSTARKACLIVAGDRVCNPYGGAMMDVVESVALVGGVVLTAWVYDADAKTMIQVSGTYRADALLVLRGRWF